MKIEVNQTSPQLWGKLGIAEARTASERLSGDAFKAWVMLALNQDSYIWQGDLEHRTVYELSDRGYLTPVGDVNYLFQPDGEPEDVNVPVEWSRIADLYGSSDQQDLSYVRDKLKSACLDDRMWCWFGGCGITSVSSLGTCWKSEKVRSCCGSTTSHLWT